MNKQPGKQKASLSLVEIIGYGLGSHCFSVPYLNFTAYLTLFLMTDIIGIPTAMAASAYSIGSILSSVANFGATAWIDTTRSHHKKLGKYSFWSIVGSGLCVILSVLAFWNWGFENPLYSAIAYVVFWVLGRFPYYVWWLCMRTLVNPMSKSSADAIALNTSSQVAGSIGRLGYGIVGATVIAWFANTKQPYAWALFFWSMLVFLFNFLLVKVANKYEIADTSLETRLAAGKNKEVKIGLKDMIGAMKGKAAWYYLSSFFGNIHGGFFFTLLVYYTSYVLNSPETMALAVTWVSIGGIVGSLITPYVVRFFKDIRMAYVWSMIGMGVMYFLTYVWGYIPVAFLIIRTLIGVVTSIAGVLYNAIANNVITYNELKGQSNAKAFVFGMASVLSTFGYTLSTVVASFGLAIAGYQAGQEITAKVMNGISIMMGIGPAIFCFITAFCIFMCKMDEKELDDYRAQKAM